MKTIKYKNDSGEDFSVNIDKTDILTVYSGKQGCTCGCRGKYSDKKQSISRVWTNIQKFDEATMVFEETFNTDEKSLIMWFDDDDKDKCYAVRILLK